MARLKARLDDVMHTFIILYKCVYLFTFDLQIETFSYKKRISLVSTDLISGHTQVVNQFDFRFLQGFLTDGIRSRSRDPVTKKLKVVKY